MIVATPAELPDQTPPPAASVKVVVVPGQTIATPVMGNGAALIDMDWEEEHPALVKLMMAEPPERPVTSPDAEPTVARVVLLLLHTPGPESLNDADAPTHKFETPDTAAGEGLTVTTVLVLQPAVVI